MKLEANMKADLVGFKLYHNQETGTKITQLVISAKFTRDKARELLGVQFSSVAFAGLTHDGEIPVHGHSGVKVREFWERHNVKISGHGPFAVNPEWDGDVKPVKDEEAVVVRLKLPLVIEKKETIGDLALRFGDVIDLSFQASQQELPLGPAGLKIVEKRPSGNFGNSEMVVNG